MLYKKLCAGTKCYGTSNDPPPDVKQEKNVAYDDPENKLINTLNGVGHDFN